MLIATFAVSLLLYYIATAQVHVLGKIVGTLTGLNRPIGDGTLIVRWIWVVDVIAAAGALAALLLLLTRTKLGLHMRAAAADFRTARLLGVRANRTIFVAVVLSGALAAVVAVLMTAEHAVRHARLRAAGHDHRPRRGASSAGSTGSGAPRSAASRSASRAQALAGFLPSTGSWPFTSGVYLDSAVFGARHPHAAAAARRPVHAAEAPGGGAGMKVEDSSSSPAPSGCSRWPGFWAASSRTRARSSSRRRSSSSRWSSSLYVFVGNSGVISFGQIGFFLVGAYAAGELSIPAGHEVEHPPERLPRDRRPLGRELLVARDRGRSPAGSSRSSSGSR